MLSHQFFNISGVSVENATKNPIYICQLLNMETTQHSQQNIILAAVYLLPSINHNAIQQEETKNITLIGVEQDQQMAYTKFLMILSKVAELARLFFINIIYNFAQYQNILIKNVITDYPRLFIQKGDQIKEQNMFSLLLDMIMDLLKESLIQLKRIHLILILLIPIQVINGELLQLIYLESAGYFCLQKIFQKKIKPIT